MGIIAIVGIIKAINELALTVRVVRDQWQKDNPGQPVPEELDDKTLNANFAKAISGAAGAWDDVIARLEARRVP